MKTNEGAEVAICNFLLSKFIYYLKFLRRYCKISPNKETTLAQICEIEGFVPHSSILEKGVTFTETNGKIIFEFEPYGYAVIK